VSDYIHSGPITIRYLCRDPLLEIKMSVDTKIAETLDRMRIHFHFLDRASAFSHTLLVIGTYFGRYINSLDCRSEFAHSGRDLNCCAAMASVSHSILRARTPEQDRRGSCRVTHGHSHSVHGVFEGDDVCLVKGLLKGSYFKAVRPLL
jgi:hypothetical protein